MKDIHQKLLAAFDVEHREHMSRIRLYLDGLRSGADTDALKALLSEAFRSAHSLKGASRVVDLKTVSDVAHKMESLFARVQSQKTESSDDFIHTMRLCIEIIEDTVAASRSGATLPDTTLAHTMLDALLNNEALPLPPEVQAAPKVEVLAPIEVAKPVQPARPTGAVSATAPRMASSGFDTMRLSVEHFDRLLKTSGEVISFTRNQDEAAHRLRDMYRILREMQKEWNGMQKHSAAILKNQNSDPDTMRLAKYFSYVESQIRTLGRQLRIASTNQAQDAFMLRNLGEKLQDDVQTARLMTAGEVLESFPKMMRDLAKDDGKEIEFSTSGMDLEADRLVLQAIKDPLMHILRNALSHGIEPASERSTAQKSKTGHIRLSLELQSRRLLVKIADDGRGLNHDAIKRKALENGLASESELDSMTPAELSQLIFSAGFSTAEKISDISGRGVGLNVVKDAVDKLQGEVFVESTPGFGCRFVISVPLSLSTHRLLLLKSQNQVFAVPTHAVQSVQRAKRQDLSTIEGRNVIKSKGLYIPIMALSQLLGMKETTVSSDQDTFSLAILKFGEKRLAVAVDGLVGEKEGLIKELGLPLSRSNRFAGGILLDRNAVALVINPPALFEAYLQLKSGRPLEIAQKTAEKPKLRILVVDDSFTTRILEKSILEAKGYNVSVATDGLEALAFLKAHEVDLIISDVEMPRMDGLALLREVRSMPKTAKTPVIMVSSRDTREEQERGLNLGADAYLSKQEFNQSVLLETIRQVV